MKSNSQIISFLRAVNLSLPQKVGRHGDDNY